MLIFDELNNAIILDSIHTPTISDSFWVLDLAMEDFTLAPLLVLEESTCPSIVLDVDGYSFPLPTNWNILVCDPETMVLDVVEISGIGGKEFHVMKYGPHKSMIETSIVTVVDYIPDHVNVGPALSKQQMLCHPINQTTWVNVAPTDVYNKYLKNLVAGNLT